jgi:hypothetical protein
MAAGAGGRCVRHGLTGVRLFECPEGLLDREPALVPVERSGFRQVAG